MAYKPTGRPPGRPRKPTPPPVNHASTFQSELAAIQGNAELFFPSPVRHYLGGPQTSYEPRLCADVVQYLSQGFSLSSFCGAIGVTRQTVVNWASTHADFRDAVKIAKLRCQQFWELQLLEVAQKGTHTSGRVTAIQFALKNLAKEDWTDSTKVEVSGGGGMRLDSSNHDLRLLSVEELVQLEQLSSKATRTEDDPEGVG